MPEYEGHIFVTTKAPNYRALKKRYPGILLEWVDDKEVMGICESCREPILSGEAYESDC